MEFQINNIDELKDFVLNSDVGLSDKIKITNQCLNIVILGNIDTIAELIETIDDNGQNQNKRIVLGKGINPIDDK
ncbi:hypothetical protein SAMN05444372_10991 [Flavobacterium micromati]|uniref:Uncharacterized protein n=1 Tax=Flavobacterium micromati TaxID=229205 RepID=A0A1M5M8U6_9FLAO|nr:hypothetical protein [Flavobacterium micromati]SHG73697.1 hypothetical protein SAMN05444372_10991 [Flavobacterium micromati]